MTNVVSLGVAHRPLRQTAPSKPSPLDFVAYERPLWYEGATGTKYNNSGHKALVRMKDGQPVCLNVVQDSYKVVQNKDLFEQIDRNICEGVGTQAFDNAEIFEQIAYEGRTCIREYRFPDIKVDSPERDKICFRIIALNGFGGSAIKVIAGAIDFFCMNGVIRGEYTREYGRHTTGLQLAKFGDQVRKSIDVFWKDRELWTEMRQTTIKDDEKVIKWLNEKFGDRLGAKLYRQYLIEQKSRGGTNFWALYSALTYYASHADGDFTLRKTGNDHAATTMLGREAAVRSQLVSGAWDELMKEAA